MSQRADGCQRAQATQPAALCICRAGLSDWAGGDGRSPEAVTNDGEDAGVPLLVLSFELVDVDLSIDYIKLSDS